MQNILSKTFGTVRVTCLRILAPRRWALSDIPPELYEYWSRTAHIEFQGIPRDAFFFARAMDALLDFFECVKRSNRSCALPSKAADSIWHAWLQYSPASLDGFCERHMGRRIPHVEAVDMTGGMALPMATALVAARGLDGFSKAGPGVPRLFATDRVLRMPDGFAWQARGNWTICSSMNEQGRPVGEWRIPAATKPDFLLAAGLISRSDHDVWLLRCKLLPGVRASTGAVGGICDAVCHIAAGSSNSGSDGGSSCGSSCGGGCGGGGCSS